MRVGARAWGAWGSVEQGRARARAGRRTERAAGSGRACAQEREGPGRACVTGEEGERGGRREKRKVEKKRKWEKEKEREREIFARRRPAARARALVGHGAAVGGTRRAEQGKERNETAIDSEI